MAGANLYIAGQTAPGQGIQLRLASGKVTPLVIKNTHDVLVRFIKSRPGAGVGKSPAIDALTIESGRNIYVDRLSLQFASDETVNVHVNRLPTRDITIARSIIGLSLDKSRHPKGKHSKGALICSSEGPVDAGIPCGKVTLFANLFAHHRDRNPDLKATAGLPIEVINNVFYDPISQFGEFYNLLGDLDVRYIGNLAVIGPSTKNRKQIAAVEGFAWDPRNKLEIFVADSRNIVCGRGKQRRLVDPAAERFLVEAAVGGSGIKPWPQAELLDRLLAHVGAGTRAWGGLDSLDRRIIEQFRTCTGQVINAPEEAGGWPDLPRAMSEPDSDGDGMPDAWERDLGLDPHDRADGWRDKDRNGRADFEDYLSWLAGDAQPATVTK
ncbi:MAG: hypothetical protein KKB37_05645 [Alphaproteobacteria bacterium]|nr:hypothetical protein [Alphaproteobacteria bacterium]